MKVTLKLDSKEITRIVSGLKKIVSDNESLLRYSNLSAEARYIAERNIEETEKLIKRIQSAHAAQTIQYFPEGEKK